MVFLPYLGLATSVGLTTTLVLQTMCRSKHGHGLPEFSAHREDAQRNSYLVTVTYLKGTRLKNVSCALDPWDGHAACPNGITLRPGCSTCVLYTMSLTDTHPKNVIVRWTKWGKVQLVSIPIT